MLFCMLQTHTEIGSQPIEGRRRFATGLGWVVLWGLEILFEGRRESVLKINGSPNHSTLPSQTGFFFASYSALNASNHRLYCESMSSETLGLRSSKICRKSAIVNARGFASLSVALPDSKNSPIKLNWADWQTSRMSLPEKPSARRANSGKSTSSAICRLLE